jgi:hypothetical protein
MTKGMRPDDAGFHADNRVVKDASSAPPPNMRRAWALLLAAGAFCALALNLTLLHR